MIFKQESSSQELFDSMEKAQIDAVLEEEDHDNRLIFEAMNELNAAAQSFEKQGRKARAHEVTALMVSLAENSDDYDDAEAEEVDAEDDEVKKVFMFFGFEPEDLKDLKV